VAGESDRGEKSEAGPLGRLVEAVREGPKYRHVAPDFISRIGQAELAKGRGWKEAVKATKRKLHQVAGAYLDAGVHYDRWLEELREAGQEDLRKASARIMKHHASTRERLPLLEEFYVTTLAGLPPIHSVLDLGCGLNPLALPWMPLAEGAAYHAWDVYEDMAAFLNRFFALLPIQGQARAGDILGEGPQEPVDLALLLKMIPCLEQVEQSAGRRLLEGIRADTVLVSFPVHSLGGRRDRGMEVNYEAHFQELIAGKPWAVERFDFVTELVFRAEKGQGTRGKGQGAGSK
jgi:16S rRNA (guanine(1405)-N(7))-methyltransferase